MADNHEEVFAEAAQAETLVTQSEQLGISNSDKSNTRTTIEEDPSETTPLVSTTIQRQPYPRAGASYDRAINEPWTGAHRAGHVPWYKKPSIYWYLPGFFPFCIAFGGLVVPKTYLILNLICKEYLAEKAAKDPLFTYMPVIFGPGENPQCRDFHVQRRNAWFNIYMDWMAGIFSAIVTPYIGALSDRYGRKKVMIITSMGGIINEIISIIVGAGAGEVSYYWLLLGALSDGLSGSFTAGMAIAFAYAADCTAPDKRATVFGRFSGTFFFGFALGPMLAAFLIRKFGNVMVVFYVTLGCHVFFILYALLLIPESLSKERQLLAREKHAAKKAETADETWWQVLKKYNLFKPLGILRPTGPGSSPSLRRNLLILAMIDTMMFGVAMGIMRVILIYVEYRFGWDPVTASFFMSTTSFTRVGCLLILLPLVHRIFQGSQRVVHTKNHGSSSSELNIIRTAIVFDIIGYLGFAIAPVSAVMFASGVIAAFGGIGSPTLASAITKHITADMTGQVLGASGLLHALSRVVAPTLCNLIYGLTVEYYPGIVFFCLAGVFVFIFLISFSLKPNVYLKDATTLADEDSQSE